jgi:hypothetical protein
VQSLVDQLVESLELYRHEPIQPQQQLRSVRTADAAFNPSDEETSAPPPADHPSRTQREDQSALIGIAQLALLQPQRRCGLVVLNVVKVRAP